MRWLYDIARIALGLLVAGLMVGLGWMAFVLATGCHLHFDRHYHGQQQEKVLLETDDGVAAREEDNNRRDGSGAAGARTLLGFD